MKIDRHLGIASNCYKQNHRVSFIAHLKKSLIESTGKEEIPRYIPKSFLVVRWSLYFLRDLLQCLC